MVKYGLCGHRRQEAQRCAYAPIVKKYFDDGNHVHCLVPCIGWEMLTTGLVEERHMGVCRSCKEHRRAIDRSQGCPPQDWNTYTPESSSY